MSLAMDQILSNESSVVNDKGVRMGWVGAVAGFLLADKMNYGTFGTVAAISGGHLVGHSLVQYV